ncbi:hypothetical protein C4569_04115 [Candidatus Parcubacteria bacterium]|nr:MAG: hypothetical protein C4569_04115 [Candidatus Parcubacteria bacterium]
MAEVKNKKKKKPSTQRHLEIAEIKDDVVVLRDGTLRAVLLISSINFALKSDDEQTAIISAYVNFLNSLQFPLQIVIQSRKLDIRPYLDNLSSLEKEQTNELLRLQISDYRGYVSELVELGDIMTKRFYIVIPYDPVEDKHKSWYKRFIEIFKSASVVSLSKENFIKRKRELLQRVQHVVGNLNSIGLNVVMLDTQSLIELYYNTYNPEVAPKEKITDLNKINLE